MIDKIGEILDQHKSELRERYVVFEPDVKMDLIKFVELEEYLSELWGVKVDQLMKSALKPRLGKRILKEVVYV